MAKNTANIFIPTAYSVWTAPLGTTAPTSPSGSPSASFYEFGYLSDNGITEGHDINATNIYDLLGTLVGVAKTQEARPFTCEALEDNVVVRSLKYPGSSVSSTAGTATVQTVTISGTPTGGTFTLTVAGYGTTAALAYNATGGTVQTALQAITGLSSVTATGSAGGPYTVTFPAALGAIAAMTASSSLTGGTPTIAVVIATPGVAPVNTRNVAGNNSQNLRSFLIYVAKGSKHKLYVINNGEAVQTGTVGVTGGGASISQFQIQPYPDSNGNFFTILDDDPAQNAAVSFA